MILAQNAIQVLILMIFGMLCWGSWAAMYKLTGKWRYELFYFDVAFGMALAVVIYSSTLGSLGFDGFSFGDDLLHSLKRNWMMAFAAGAIFNLANMLMMSGVAVAGLSVAVPLGLGLSLMLGLGINLVIHNSANPLLLFVGTACLLVAVITIGVAYSFLISGRQDQLVKEGKVKTSTLPGYGQGRIVSTNAPSSTKGLLLSVVAGALMWVMIPMINKARYGDFGLGPYTLMAMFTLGMFLSTFVFNLFFVNLPVEGEPLELFAYFRGSLRAHLVGVAAGIVMCTGILAYLVAQAGPPETQLSATASYAIQQGAVLFAALLGVLAWKDFKDAEPRVRAMVWAFVILFAVGLVAIGFAGKLVAGA